MIEKRGCLYGHITKGRPLTAAKVELAPRRTLILHLLVDRQQGLEPVA